MRITTKIISWLCFVIFLAGGLLLEIYSFKGLREKRQLDRLAATQINAMLDGEVRVRGMVPGDFRTTLTGPHSQNACVYYRYLEQIEKKDSDGKTSWSTVSDDTQYSDFAIADESGTTRVSPSGFVDFNVPQKHRKRVGKKRFTEWRIDPGDTVTVVGYAKVGPTNRVIHFDIDGDYPPLITQYMKSDEDIHERASRGLSSVLMSWGGLACLSLSVLCLYTGIGWHGLLGYLAALTSVQLVALAYFSLNLIYTDLAASATRSERHEENLRKELASSFAKNQLKWSGDWEDLKPMGQYADLPPTERDRLAQMRVDLARVQTRISRQRAAFPEFMLAPLMGIPKTTPIPLPKPAQAKLDALESHFTGARLFTGNIPVFGWKMEHVGWGIVGFGLLIAVIGTRAGLRRIMIKRCIENLPTSRTNGVAFGLTELNGQAEAFDDSPLEPGPLSGRPCLYYKYVVEEKRGSGKDSKWVVVEERTHSQLFKCQDDDGAIKVFPSGAEFLTDSQVSRRSGRRRYTEKRIGEHAPVYVLGHADVDPFTGDSLMIVEPHEKSFPFIVSSLSEFQIMLRKACAGMIALNIAFSGLVLAILILFGMAGSFSTTDFLFAAASGPIFLFFVAIILHYNDMVFLRRRVDRNWSNVDVALKKRHDLIPTIERVVSGYLAHEKDLQTDLAEMRSQFGQNPSSSPENAAAYFESEAKFTTRFIGLRENYPDLKSNTLVAQMTKTLVEVENEISMMREGYNDAVETYNTRIETLPDALLAKPFGFLIRSYLQFESAIINAPDIKLGAAAAAAPVTSPTGVSNKSFNTGATITKAPNPLPAPDTSTRPDEALVTPAEPIAAPEPEVVVEPAAPISDGLVAASRNSETAYALIVSLILSETRFTAEDLPKLEKKIGDKSIVSEVQKYLAQVSAVDDRMKLSLVDHCLPALRQLPDTFNLFAVVKEFVEFDTSISLFEYTLLQVFEREDRKRADDDRPPVVQWYSWANLDPEISQVASFLANLARSSGDGDKIFGHVRQLEDKYLQLDRLALDQNTFDQVDQAVNKLAHLDPGNRRRLVDSLTQAIATIEHPTANQIDFLRAVAERLHAF